MGATDKKNPITQPLRCGDWGDRRIAGRGLRPIPPPTVLDDPCGPSQAGKDHTYKMPIG